MTSRVVWVLADDNATRTGQVGWKDGGTSLSRGVQEVPAGSACLIAVKVETAGVDPEYLDPTVKQVTGEEGARAAVYP